MKLVTIRFLPPCLLFLCGIFSPKAFGEDAEAARIRARLEATPMTEKVTLNNNEWRKILTSTQFRVLREGGTEPPFTNEYANAHGNGTYVCAACGNALFRSNTKFDSRTGWPSFYAPLAKNQITVFTDRTAGLTRQEVRCARCGSHIGHVFKDGPPPTHLRYCLNSVSLRLKRAKNE
jgi:peptide-methionine (R)-S-oxide reductase